MIRYRTSAPHAGTPSHRPVPHDARVVTVHSFLPSLRPIVHGISANRATNAPPSYTKAWTLYPYRPPLQDAICLFKYRGKVSLADPLARLMIDRLPPLEDIDLIIPVPLHAERLREREFNQSLLLADRIGRHLTIPVSGTALIRIAPAPPQTSLSRRERLNNLRGAFAVPRPASIADKRILLIDDVLTTGTTVDVCAKTLRKAGSSHVFVLTLGRTVDANHIPDRIFAQRKLQLL
ncbi:MAG: ComF family protein [Nitrospira sp.]|nr:ComF family protein [Nitrospira sp.]